MKTEHRHELKTNELRKVAVKVETFYERHAASIQWGIIGVAFLLACGIYYWRTTAAENAAAWNKLSQSQKAEEFADVASDYSGSKAAPWAKLREANSYLQVALSDSFENREKANTDLKKAKAILSDLSKTGGPRELRQQVLFANARVLEMTSDGDLQPAIDQYKKLLQEIPDTAFKLEAERRIKALQRPGAKEFYAFFSKQNPKPPEQPKPNDSKTGKSPHGDPLKPLSSGLKELQDKSGVGSSDVPLLLPPKLPNVLDSEADKTAAGKGPELKGKDEEKPATEKKPAETPASEPEKKAEEKPEAKPEEKTEEKPEAAPAKEPEAKPADAPAEKKPE